MKSLVFGLIAAAGVVLNGCSTVIDHPRSLPANYCCDAPCVAKHEAGHATYGWFEPELAELRFELMWLDQGLDSTCYEGQTQIRISKHRRSPDRLLSIMAFGFAGSLGPNLEAYLSPETDQTDNAAINRGAARWSELTYGKDTPEGRAEARRLAKARALVVLTKHQPEMLRLQQLLLKKRTLTPAQITDALGPRPAP